MVIRDVGGGLNFALKSNQEWGRHCSPFFWPEVRHCIVVNRDLEEKIVKVKRKKVFRLLTIVKVVLDSSLKGVSAYARQARLSDTVKVIK